MWPLVQLTDHLTVQEEGTVCVCGVWIWVKIGVNWVAPPRMNETSSSLAERLLWFQERWNQPFCLY